MKLTKAIKKLRVFLNSVEQINQSIRKRTLSKKAGNLYDSNIWKASLYYTALNILNDMIDTLEEKKWYSFLILTRTYFDTYINFILVKNNYQKMCQDARHYNEKDFNKLHEKIKPSLKILNQKKLSRDQLLEVYISLSAMEHFNDLNKNLTKYTTKKLKENEKKDLAKSSENKLEAKMADLIKEYYPILCDFSHSGHMSQRSHMLKKGEFYQATKTANINPDIILDILKKVIIIQGSLTRTFIYAHEKDGGWEPSNVDYFLDSYKDLLSNLSMG